MSPINSMFAIPYYKSTIDKKSYDKSKILKDIIGNYKIQSERDKWDTGWSRNSNLHHSYGDLNNPKFKSINYSKLIPIYTDKITDFFNQYFDCKVFFKFSIENYTCMGKNQHMREHDHPYSEFSAVHYVKFNHNEHLPTIYSNPAHWASYSDRLISKKFFDICNNSAEKHSWIWSKYKLNIQEDDFVITPSVLRHYVPPQQSDDLRITIVLNIFVLDDQ